METAWFFRDTLEPAFQTRAIDLTFTTEMNLRVGTDTDYFVNQACGRTSASPGDAPPNRALWSSDFNFIAAVRAENDRDAVVVIDARRGTVSEVVEPDSESDFGPAPATARHAGFTVGGDLVWSEQSSDGCVTYQAPFSATSTIARDDLDQYKVGEGVCDQFAHLGGDTVVCESLFRGSCEDFDGNEVDIDSPDRVSLPDSSRFALTGAFQPEPGEFYFVGKDFDTKDHTLFVWNGTDSEPTPIAGVGPGYWYPLGVAQLSDIT